MPHSRLIRKQFLPADREWVFDFFANAANLELITPPFLHFQTIKPPTLMEGGTRIDYRLRLRGIPFRWSSRISSWEPPIRFVDEQIRGPYRFWTHEHRFEESNGGTLVTDTIHYRVPGGVFAPLIDRLYVRRDLISIFDYRSRTLAAIFRSGEGVG